MIASEAFHGGNVIENYWQKIAMLLLFKFAKRQKVDLTLEEIQNFSKAFASDPVLLCQENDLKFTFQLIEETLSQEILAYNRDLRGRYEANVH